MGDRPSLSLPGKGIRQIRSRSALVAAITLASLTLFAGKASCAAPGNDNFADAFLLASDATIDTRSNNTLATDPASDQPTGSSTYVGKTVWWNWTAPADETLNIDTQGTGLWSKNLAVYVGKEVKNLKLCDNTTYSDTRTLTIPAVKGVTYYIRVGTTYGSTGGPIQLNLTHIPLSEGSRYVSPETPNSDTSGNYTINDNFANSVTLTGNATTAIAYNQSATNPASDQPTGSNTSDDKTVWWNWTAQSAGDLNIDTQGTATWSKTLAVYDGKDVKNLKLLDSSTSSDSRPLPIRVVNGVTYFIRVGTIYGSTGGPIQLNLNFAGKPGVPQPNPFASVAGSYFAMVSSAATKLFVTLQLNASGAITGTIHQYGISYRITPLKLSEAGVGTLMWGGSPIALSMDKSTTPPVFSGVFSAGNSTSFVLQKAAYTGKKGSVSPLAGKVMNSVFEFVPDAGELALGHGFAQFTFGKNGAARMVGKLPDGTVLTGSLVGLHLTSNTTVSTFPISLAWKGTSFSTLVGELSAAENGIQQTADLSGDLDWNKPANGQRKFLPSGFSGTLSVVGSVWTTPNYLNAMTGVPGDAGFRLILDPDAQIFAQEASCAGSWPATNKPVITKSDTVLKFAVSQKTGSFTGQVLLPAEGAAKRKSAAFQGLLLGTQAQMTGGPSLYGGGFFFGPGASAKVELQPAK